MRKKVPTIKLSENLNDLIKKRGISLSQTAKRVGMNKTTLHNYCNGVIPKNLISLYRLAQFFDIELSDLIFDNQSSTSQTNKICVSQGQIELIIRQVPLSENQND